MYHNDAIFMEQVSGSWVHRVFERGYLAVDLFIALSGFLLAYKYRHRFQRLTLASYTRFLGLRLARIYPLFFVVLTFRVAVEFAKWVGMQHDGFMGDRPFTGETGPLALLSNYLLIQAWGFYDEATWVPAHWSISAEWFTYLLFPMIVALAYRMRARRDGYRRIAMWLVVAACLGVLAQGCAVFGQLEFPMEYSLLRCLPMFVIGMVLATEEDCVRQRVQRIRGFQRGVNATMMLAIIGACCGLAWRVSDLAVSLLLIVMVFTGPLVTGRLRDLLNLRVFNLLGELSYAIYLSHMPIQRVISIIELELGDPFRTAPLCAFLFRLAVIVATSYLLHRAIELPARDKVRRWLEGRNVSQKAEDKAHVNGVPFAR